MKNISGLHTSALVLSGIAPRIKHSHKTLGLRPRVLCSCFMLGVIPDKTAASVCNPYLFRRDRALKLQMHSCGLLAFLTPFVFHLLHRLVTCRPFSVKLSPSGTGCLLLSSLLRLSLPFDPQFDATLSLICSPMVYLSYFLSFHW